MLLIVFEIVHHVRADVVRSAAAHSNSIRMTSVNAALGRHPSPVRKLVPEPRELPLRIAARVPLPPRHRFFKADFTAQAGQQARHPVGAHGGKHRIEISRRERPHFVERACFHHMDEAMVDPLPQLVSLRRQEHLADAPPCKRSRTARPVKRG